MKKINLYLRNNDILLGEAFIVGGGSMVIRDVMSKFQGVGGTGQGEVSSLALGKTSTLGLFDIVDIKQAERVYQIPFLEDGIIILSR